MSEYVTMPREPTHAMLTAASEGIRKAQEQGWHGLSPIDIYRAMLAAAPALSAAPAQAPGREEVREAIHAWIREDTEMAVKLTLTPKQIDKLLDRLDPRP